jgi:hypothetical protein
MNNYKILMRLALLLLPLLGRGLGGGGALFAQPVDLQVCYGKGYTLQSTAAAPAIGATSYTWYEDGKLLDGKTASSLTIPAGKAAGAYAYVRVAANAECPTGVPSNTFTVRVLSAVSPGTITTASTTTTPGANPNVTIASLTDATGGSGSITYQWRRTGNSSATLTGTTATYTIGTDAANYATAGTYYFNRYAKDATCNTAWVAATGTYTLYVPCPLGVPATLCTQCCWSGSTWMDCCATTNAYPFDNNTTNTVVVWSGNGNTFYSGASGTYTHYSDRDGRVNTANIPSSTITVNAVQICKDLGAGWYLPAYEELVKMSAASLLDKPDSYYWSSTECYRNGGRYSHSNTDYQAAAVLVPYYGYLYNNFKSRADYYVHCAWRN